VQGRPVGVLQVPGLHLDGYMANKLTYALQQLTDPSRAVTAGPALPPPPAAGAYTAKPLAPQRPAVRRDKDPQSGTAGA
jgi:hypothetical protein